MGLGGVDGVDLANPLPIYAPVHPYACQAPCVPCAKVSFGKQVSTPPRIVCAPPPPAPTPAVSPHLRGSPHSRWAGVYIQVTAQYVSQQHTRATTQHTRATRERERERERDGDLLNTEVIGLDRENARECARARARERERERESERGREGAGARSRPDHQLPPRARTSSADRRHGHKRPLTQVPRPPAVHCNKPEVHLSGCAAFCASSPSPASPRRTTQFVCESKRARERRGQLV